MTLPQKTLLFDLYGLFMRTQSEADKQAIERAAQLEQLAVEPAKFWQAYRDQRDPLDAGRMNFAQYVAAIGERLGVDFPSWEAIFEADCQSWSFHDDAMVQWLYALKEGVKTGEHNLRIALLSNIPAALLAKIREEKPWLREFDPAFFSCGLGIAKPQEKIFTYAVKVLETTPERVLFLDDTKVNIDAARRIGLNTHHFTDISGAQSAVAEFMKV
ncbi:putative hydrolase of the HAD superfamily [Arcanobacterium pluranimalium]|uniref:HAD-IA family hydrolase n=1 Tax=Arcanobacterium pluranimalium TaxID=108028 RepID=UPI00195ADB8E|nr:HAD-IA family hydrolase [Arcanobacterium pluranimalium]MBM7824493.1 putative hydrolase of the HAD superfamily [Arcanobacterium pluranimalium]